MTNANMSAVAHEVQRSLSSPSAVDSSHEDLPLLPGTTFRSARALLGDGPKGGIKPNPYPEDKSPSKGIRQRPKMIEVKDRTEAPPPPPTERLSSERPLPEIVERAITAKIVQSDSRSSTPRSPKRADIIRALSPISTSRTVGEDVIKDDYPTYNFSVSSSHRRGGRTTSFTAELKYPLKSVYGVRLLSLSMNPPRNVTALNNRLHFKRAGQTFETEISEGSYTIFQLTECIKRSMNEVDGNDYKVVFYQCESKIGIHGHNPFSLLFGEKYTNSIASLLGWDRNDTITTQYHMASRCQRIDEDVGVCILLGGFAQRGITSGGAMYTFRASSPPGKKKWKIFGSAPSARMDFREIQVTLNDDFGANLSEVGEWSMELELRMIPREYNEHIIGSRASSPEPLPSPRDRIVSFVPSKMIGAVPSSPRYDSHSSGSRPLSPTSSPSAMTFTYKTKVQDDRIRSGSEPSSPRTSATSILLREQAPKSPRESTIVV